MGLVQDSYYRMPHARQLKSCYYSSRIIVINFQGFTLILKVLYGNVFDFLGCDSSIDHVVPLFHFFHKFFKSLWKLLSFVRQLVSLVRSS